MTFDPSSALHFGQGFIRVKFWWLVAVIRHCQAWIYCKILKHCSTCFGRCCVLSKKHCESIVFCYQINMIARCLIHFLQTKSCDRCKLKKTLSESVNVLLLPWNCPPEKLQSSLFMSHIIPQEHTKTAVGLPDTSGCISTNAARQNIGQKNPFIAIHPKCKALV